MRQQEGVEAAARRQAQLDAASADVSAKWADLRKREAAAETGLKEVADWRGSLRDEARRAAAEADDRADAIVSSSI